MSDADIIKKARADERLKQRIETARFIEQHRGLLKRRYIAKGGFMGHIGMSLGELLKGIKKVT